MLHSLPRGEAKLPKYVLIFSGYYLGFMTVLTILAHGFNIDLGAGADTAMLIGAGYASATKFVNDLQRVPSKNTAVPLRDK